MNTLSALNITPSPPRMCRVAIYIRVSTLQQVDKDSLPMQRKDLIAYSKLILNTDDYVIFEDAGYSGKISRHDGTNKNWSFYSSARLED